MSRAWLLLFIAGVLEIVWAVGMKYTDGFTKLWPSAFVFVVSTIGFVMLAIAVRELPLGTAYAIWVGIGTVGTVILGIMLFNEPITVWRMFFMLLIGVGIIGLKAHG